MPTPQDNTRRQRPTKRTEHSARMSTPSSRTERTTPKRVPGSERTAHRRTPLDRSAAQNHSGSSRNLGTERSSRKVNPGLVDNRQESANWERLASNNEGYVHRSAKRGIDRRTTRDRMPQKNSGILNLPIIIALVILAILVFSIVSCVSTPSNQPEENALATSDRAAGEAQTITLSFAGDCTIGTDPTFDPGTSFVAKYLEADDPSYFFANVAGIFNDDDATIVNMEGTLTESTDRADKTFAFKAKSEYAQVLKAGGVEAASLANNHSRDYGEQSYTDTIEAVEAAGIATFGYDRIAYLDVKGVKVALIGTYELAEGINCKDEMVSNIQTAKEAGAQIIVVYFHWGTERETVPESTQMTLGHAAIDAGATLVIGSHPHVIQGLENYNGHTIAYSLGNFCFGGNSNPSDKDCMIVQQTFTVRGNDVKIDDTNIIPCSISSTSSYNNYQPTPATGSEKERIEAKINSSSEAIANMAASE